MSSAPGDLNLASHFLDRNVAEGQGGRTALIGAGGTCTFTELAALTNRIRLGTGIMQNEAI